MPQDSYQQAIVRQALGRFPATVGDPATELSFALSSLEIAVIRSVLEEFIRVPSEPVPGDPPQAGT